MIDLSEIPTEVLKAELEKRRLIAKAAREKAAREKVCCRNCAHRTLGKSNYRNYSAETTWICEVKRRQTITNRTYFANGPQYNYTYYVCGRKHDGCELFIHKDSETGKRIIQERKSMADRFD